MKNVTFFLSAVFHVGFENNKLGKKGNVDAEK